MPTTFPTEQHQPFEAPPELKSENGLLETTFDVQPTTFNVAGAKVRGYAYQGQFMGPTLRVLPGDTVRIHLRNQLKEPTNLHSHGMYVSPIGISDNVLRIMKAGSNNDFVLHLPGDVEPGTYWYHTHLHGHVEEQVFAGLSGVLIVDGLIDRLPPQLQDVPDRVMALKDLQIKDGPILWSNIDSNAPTTRTVNGQVDPVLTVQTNQTQLLRLTNIGADIWYRLRLGGANSTSLPKTPTPLPKSGLPMSLCCLRARGTTSSSDGQRRAATRSRPCPIAPGPTETTTPNGASPLLTSAATRSPTLHGLGDLRFLIDNLLSMRRRRF